MRRSPIITGRWTAARQAWLERLEQGPAVRAGTVVGFQCYRLGWTEWEDGPTNREKLTEDGRAKLAEWRAEGRAP